MKKLLFCLGAILFCWPLTILIGGVIKGNEATSILSFGLYKLMTQSFSGFFAFISLFSLIIVGFLLMYFFSSDKNALIK